MSRSYRKYPFRRGLGDYRHTLNRKLRHRNKQSLHQNQDTEFMDHKDVVCGYLDVDWVVYCFTSKGSGYYEPDSPEISLDRETGEFYIETTIEENKIQWKKGMSK